MMIEELESIRTIFTRAATGKCGAHTLNIGGQVAAAVTVAAPRDSAVFSFLVWPVLLFIGS